MWNFNFVCRRVPNSENSTRDFKKIFLVKAKKYFVLGVPKSCKRVKLNKKKLKKKLWGMGKRLMGKHTNFQALVT